MSGSVHDSLTEYSQKLSLALYKLELIKEVAKYGLNADSGDEEREALAEVASIVGLTAVFDEEEDMWRYE